MFKVIKNKVPEVLIQANAATFFIRNLKNLSG